MQAKFRLGGVSPRCASASFLRRERGYDFFEARIAAQGIPHRIQAQFAITWTRRDSGERLELLKRQFTFARPGTNHGKPRSCKSLIIRWPPHCFWSDGHQFHRAPAFAQRLLLSSQGCIDQPEISKYTHIIRVNAYLFLQLSARSHKCSGRRRDVSFQTSNHAQPKVTPILLGKRRRKAASGVQFAIKQSKIQARAS